MLFLLGPKVDYAKNAKNSIAILLLADYNIRNTKYNIT